jgi:DNA-binding transcriptional LysR family regulator
LFDRIGRNVVLTDAGRRVVDAARRVLVDVADLHVVSALARDAVVGTLTIASLPTLTVDPLAAIVGRFRAAHPGATIRIGEPEGLAGVEDEVRSGRAELGFTDLTIGAAALERIELSRQDTEAICPPGTASPGEPLTPGELVAMPLVVTPEGTSTRRLLDRALARTAVAPTIAVEVHNREAIIPLVLAGAGAALVPAEVARTAAERGAVVRPLRPQVTRRVGIIHRRGPLSPTAAALVDAALVDALRKGRSTAPRR